ncbi:LysR family transcriptional regulator [Kiloniella litopenaei]|uniref:LysR family transcriptional regulator n=1 Tax=Kiloniella litopenaei TaxID=1549748 RepID=UPI003BAB5D08
MTHNLFGSLPPLDCLQAVFVAQKTGSFSAAADYLNLTHATISRRVAVVENWCGYLLFERKARGVLATEDGQRFLSRVSKILNDMDGLIDRRGREPSVGAVRILTTSSFARFWFLPRLSMLEEMGVRLKLITSQEVQDLEKGNHDLAIRFGIGGWSDVFEVCSQKITYRPVVHKSLAEKCKDQPDTLFRTAPLLHNTDRTLWASWCKREGISLSNKRTDRILGDYGLTIDGAIQKLGVALWMQELHPLPDDLACLNLSGHLLPQGYTLIRPNREMSPETIQVIEKIKVLFNS